MEFLKMRFHGREYDEIKKGGFCTHRTGISYIPAAAVSKTAFRQLKFSGSM